MPPRATYSGNLPVFASSDPRQRVVPDPQAKARKPSVAATRPARARSTSGERYALAELRWRHSPARAALLRRQASSGRSDLDLARAKAARARLGPSPFTSTASRPTRVCPQCAGSGTVPLMMGLLPCPTCGGTGRVAAKKSDAGGKVNTEAPGSGGAGASEGGGQSGAFA